MPTHSPTPLVPELLCLGEIFTSGTLGISTKMFSGTGITPPNVSLPGLPNFEQTIIETLNTGFKPVTTIIETVGNIINSGSAILLEPNVALWVDLIANTVIAPVGELLDVIATLSPPTIETFTELLLTPITSKLKLPIDKYYFPPSEFNLLPDLFPEIVIPIPSFGDINKPSFPSHTGVTLPPNIKLLLGVAAFPLNYLFQVIEPVKLFLDSVTDPTKIAAALDSVANLGTNLLPTPEAILSKLLALIGISPVQLGTMLAVFNSFLNKIVDGIVDLIKYILGAKTCSLAGG